MLTDEQMKTIRENYKEMSSRKLAYDLAVPVRDVRSFIRSAGLRKRIAKVTPPRCENCLLWAETCCIYHVEADRNFCKTMRFTSATWPEKKTDMEILFENL